MQRPTGTRIPGLFALAVAVALPWPDKVLLAVLGGSMTQVAAQSFGAEAFDNGPGLSLLLVIGATILLLSVLLSRKDRRSIPVRRPLPAQQLLPAPMSRRGTGSDPLAWHLLGSVVDHVSDLRLRAEADMAGAPLPVPFRAQALLQFVARPGETLHRASPDLGRQTRALLQQLRD